MAHGDLEHALIHAVINSELALELGNLNGAHDARAGHIQGIVVQLQLFFGQEPVGFFLPCQGFIVCFRTLEQFDIMGIVDLSNLLYIGCNGSGLVERIPVVTDGGIQQQAKPYDQCQNQKDRGQILF